MRRWQWACVLLAVFALAIVFRPSVPVELAHHDSLVAERPRVDAVIRSAVDSGAARIAVSQRVSDAADTKRVSAERLRAVSDSLAALAITAHDWELAYRAERRRADTLASALRLSTQALDHAQTAYAYVLTAYLADSTALQEERRNGDRLAAALRRTSKRQLWDYVAVGCGMGVTGPDCFVGVRVPLGR